MKRMASMLVMAGFFAFAGCGGGNDGGVNLNGTWSGSETLVLTTGTGLSIGQTNVYDLGPLHESNGQVQGERGLTGTLSGNMFTFSRPDYDAGFLKDRSWGEATLAGDTMTGTTYGERRWYGVQAFRGTQTWQYSFTLHRLD